MAIANNITELIGQTPLVKLNRVLQLSSNVVFAKLEQLNPGASVKDRAALGMISDAEQRGILRPGGVIIEATSGNTGIALAMIAAAKGYSLIVVMPASMSIERQKILQLFGARVELTPPHLGMLGALEKAKVLQKEINDSFLVNQFDNPANPAVHETTTAEEIIADLPEQLDVLVVGVGTGGTITGLARRLRRYYSAIKIVAVEPESSPVLSGGDPGPHKIQGIGAGFIPSILETDLVDEVIQVSDSEAIQWTQKIISCEGIMAGLSSGAVACAAQKYMQAHSIDDATFLLIFPDSGERYLSFSFFTDVN